MRPISISLVVCSGEYVLDLSWPVQPVEGLLDEQSQQLRGGFRLQLEPESSLLLTKLDLADKAYAGLGPPTERDKAARGERRR